MRPLPAREPDVDRRWVIRVPPDPYVRFDTNDYSLDPGFVGRRVEVRVGQRRSCAVVLDTGELAAPARAGVRQAPHDHRAGARPRADATRRGRARAGRSRCGRLARYDALIA